MGEHNCYKKDELGCIKEKAKELWKKDGCKQGRDLDYWLQAEKVVKVQIKK
jgi:hypothetical protein